MNFEDNFSTDYYCEILSELPPTNKRRIYFPGGIGIGGQDGLMVEVIPNLGDEWIGIFAFGNISPKGVNGVYSCPDKTQLCVVSKGEGYIVDVNNPINFSTISIVPILGVISVPFKKLLVFYDFTRFLAFGSDGIQWETPSLSWDGLKINEVTNDLIIGQAWDASKGAEVGFKICLETGVYEGGASPLKGDVKGDVLK